MTEPPEIEELAKRYLDLWQDHVSGLSEDPEWMAAITRLFSTLSTLQTADAVAKPDFDAFNAWLGGTLGNSRNETATRGPRPLTTHLLTAAMTYTSSNAGLPLLRSGSLNSTLAAKGLKPLTMRQAALMRRPSPRRWNKRPRPCRRFLARRQCLSCASLSPRCGGSCDHLVRRLNGS